MEATPQARSVSTSMNKTRSPCSGLGPGLGSGAAGADDAESSIGSKLRFFIRSPPRYPQPADARIPAWNLLCLELGPTCTCEASRQPPELTTDSFRPSNGHDIK